MKKILNLLFAKAFQWAKFKSPVLYGTIIAPALLWLQTQLMDPAIIQQITEAIPDAPSIVVSLIKLLPTIVLALTGAHSTEIIKQDKLTKERGL